MKLWNDDQQAQSTLALTQVVHGAPPRHRSLLAGRQCRARGRAPDCLAGQGVLCRPHAKILQKPRRRRAVQVATRPRLMWRNSRHGWKASRVEQGRTVLYAPFDGTVAKIVGEVGEYSTPSPPGVPTPPAHRPDRRLLPLCESHRWMRLTRPRSFSGQPVRISLDAMPGKTFPGKVRRGRSVCVCRGKAGRARWISKRISISPRSAGKLLVGYSADVEVILAVARLMWCAFPLPPCLKGAVCWWPTPMASWSSARCAPGWPNWGVHRSAGEGLECGATRW